MRELEKELKDEKELKQKEIQQKDNAIKELYEALMSKCCNDEEKPID